MEGDIVTMQEIVRYEQRGLDKENRVRRRVRLTPACSRCCLKRFAEYGIPYDVRALSELERAASW